MRLAACLVFLSFPAVWIPGCGPTRVHAVRDGVSTWRGEELSFERDGGLINAHVMSESDGDVIVVLIEARAYESHRGKDVQASAAALCHPRGGRARVSFSGLPAGRYLVSAFVDVDGDGMTEEPGAGYEHVALKQGETVEIDLVVR
jgi:hypothetical protein